MQIKSNEIHTWSCSLTINAKQEAAYFTILSPDEQARALRFKFEKDKTRFIAAHYFLRKILSFYFDCSPAAVDILIGSHGKPYSNQSNLQFNLSHSKDIAIIAIHPNQAIGIDIEYIDSDPHLGVMEKYFSEEEKRAIKALPEKQQHLGFYTVWTRKEAIIKAIGKGLFRPLQDFSTINPQIGLNNEQITLELGQTTWVICPLSIHPDYKSSLANISPPKELSHFVYQHV